MAPSLRPLKFKQPKMLAIMPRYGLGIFAAQILKLSRRAFFEDLLHNWAPAENKMKLCRGSTELGHGGAFLSLPPPVAMPALALAHMPLIEEQSCARPPFGDRGGRCHILIHENDSFAATASQRFQAAPAPM